MKAVSKMQIGKSGPLHTQWKEFGRNHISQSPCVGDVREAVHLSVQQSTSVHISRVLLTVQKLLTKRLNTLSITTNNIALHFALKPTTTITQATNPNKLTNILANPQSPLHMNPTNNSIRRILPASWIYFLRSFSAGKGKPAGANLLRTQLSLSTIRSPPITLRFRRKKLRSNIRP